MAPPAILMALEDDPPPLAVPAPMLADVVAVAAASSSDGVAAVAAPVSPGSSVACSSDVDSDGDYDWASHIATVPGCRMTFEHYVGGLRLLASTEME